MEAGERPDHKGRWSRERASPEKERGALEEDPEPGEADEHEAPDRAGEEERHDEKNDERKSRGGTQSRPGKGESGDVLRAGRGVKTWGQSAGVPVGCAGGRCPTCRLTGERSESG